MKNNFISTLRTGNASNWGYMHVQSNNIPVNWDGFEQVMTAELITSFSYRSFFLHNLLEIYELFYIVLKIAHRNQHTSKDYTQIMVIH